MKKLIIILCILGVALPACAMYRHRQCVRDNFLVLGLNRKAFIAEWGNPDYTETTQSDEFTKARANFGNSWGGSFGFFHGSVPLDVWHYYSRDTVLVFNGLELVAWKKPKPAKESGKSEETHLEGAEAMKEGVEKLFEYMSENPNQEKNKSP